ncbi:MAG: ATP-binding protein [Lachnospiraceae bacterium]|nr:ATP-binding protein [Lachnospiraceae bacterium]
MAQKVGIGYQSFREVREENIFYIDKTLFIKEWWEYADKVTLVTRPRRFGKTLNLSMLECFFSNQYAGRSDLFEGLAIWDEKSSAGDYKYRQIQGGYPVIALSFASIKTGKTDGMKTAVKQIIANVYQSFRHIMQSELFDEKDRAYFRSVNDDMTDETAYISLNRLCTYLKKFYDTDVIILLDEYDTPMQEAWLAGNWNETVAFFRSFFNATFKTNPHLYRGLITGITRISKESIFSDLNNLEVVSTTSDKYATQFGFTEEEVFQALDDMELGQEKQMVKQWYDGFTFGTHTDIYNAWSIISFISKKGRYDTYWADTSSNGLVNSLIRRGTSGIKQTMEQLMQGKSFEAEIDEQIVFHQLDMDENAIWSLLMATGYLKVIKIERKGRLLKKIYTLSLTNMEVENMFARMMLGWFKNNGEDYYNNFIKALLLDDVDARNEYMNKIALQSFSSFDVAKSASEADDPERFYHGFVLGMMVDLDGRFVITSNKESGFGRYDIMMKPTDKEKDNAYIIEFKVHKPKREKNLEETVVNALAQIAEKQYETELIAEGIAPERIRKYGFAFEGKTCLIG